MLVFGAGLWCWPLVLVFGAGLWCWSLVLAFGAGVWCWRLVLAFGVARSCLVLVCDSVFCFEQPAAVGCWVLLRAVAVCCCVLLVRLCVLP